MIRYIVLGLAAMFLLHGQTADAAGTDAVTQYVISATEKAKAASDPVQKRTILDTSLRNMLTAIDRVERSGGISAGDREGLDRLAATLQEERNELSGVQGYERVADSELNAFSGYMVQNMEQADRTVTISLTVLLLIIIIILLIA